jgi:uncharacterized protein (TIRG00374 family)
MVEKEQEERKKWVWLRAGISIAIICILLWRIDIRQLFQAFLQAKVSLWGVAFLLMVLEQGLMALAWNVLLRAKGYQIPFNSMFYIFLMGNFFGLALPSSAGSDAVKGYAVFKQIDDGVNTVSSLILFRVLGIGLLITIASICVLVFGSLFRDEKIVFIVLGLMFLFVLFFVFLSLRIVRNLLKKTLNYKYLRKIGDFSLRLYDSIIEYKKYRSALGKVLLISCGIQASRILGIYVVGLSIGITLSIQYYMIIVPVVIVITLIPVTVAGLGLREISFIYLFEQIGFSGTAAFTLSILIDLIILLLSLIGGVIYFIKGFSPTKEKA